MFANQSDQLYLPPSCEAVLETENCPTSVPRTGFVSFPGSGATWIRLLIEVTSPYFN